MGLLRSISAGSSRPAFSPVDFTRGSKPAAPQNGAVGRARPPGESHFTVAPIARRREDFVAERGFERVGTLLRGRLHLLGIDNGILAGCLGVEISTVDGLAEGQSEPPEGFLYAVMRGRSREEVLWFLGKLYSGNLEGDFEGCSSYWWTMRLLRFSPRYNPRRAETIALYSFFHVPRSTALYERKRPSDEWEPLAIELGRQMVRFHLTLDDIAKALVVDRSTICLWGQGRRHPPEDLVAGLREARSREQALYLTQMLVETWMERFEERHPYCHQVLILKGLLEERDCQLGDVGLPESFRTGLRDLSEIIETVRKCNTRGEIRREVGRQLSRRGTLRPYQEDPLNRGLRRLCDRLHLSCDQIAQICSLTPTAVTSWVSGKRKVGRRWVPLVQRIVSARSISELRRIARSVEHPPPLRRTPSRPIRPAEAKRIGDVLSRYGRQIGYRIYFELARFGLNSADNRQELLGRVNEQVARAVMRRLLGEGTNLRPYLNKVILGEAVKLFADRHGLKRSHLERLRQMTHVERLVGRMPTIDDLVGRFGMRTDAARQRLDEYRTWRGGGPLVELRGGDAWEAAAFQ